MTSIWMLTYTLPSRYNWMYQYFLNDQGLLLSWVGSGRYIFSHNYTDEDFSAVQEKFVAAARAMRNEGWWVEGARLSNKEIKRQVASELLATRFGRAPARS